MAAVQHTFGAGAICTDGRYGPVPRAVAAPVAPPGGLGPGLIEQEAEDLLPVDIDRPRR